ncbi:hypothetical protein DV738_g5643, partial [Chaetothyriales sp. CBS 135597]
MERVLLKNSGDTSIPRYVAIKIAALDIDATWETRISKLIANAEPSHEGLDFVRTHIDEFKLPGENIKDDNIMVTIESDSVLTKFVKHQKQNIQPKHIRTEDGRETYLSQGNFGPLQGTRLLPKLGDFNLVFPGLADGNGHLAAIQSHRFRAPEVILGCPWSYSVDIWNLGLLMWNFLEDVSLFDRPAGEDDKILRTDLVHGRKLADTITALAGDEKDVFLDFAFGMLQWLPDKRKTARELLQHPIFNSLNERRARYR